MNYQISQNILKEFGWDDAFQSALTEARLFDCEAARIITDGRGRHTTTGSRLYLIPSGVLIIDTPGIRAVGIAAGPVSAEASFEDISELARGCRFVDCRHQSEPGCAVKEALLRGEIEKDRYLNYLRLTGEASSREEELQKRREKDRYIGKLRYRMRKEGRRRGSDGR